MSKSLKKRKSATTEFSAKRARLSLRLLLLSLMLIPPIAGWGQSADIAGEGKEPEASDDSSQHVEESEEAYRRRMETAESHDQADVMRPRSSGTTKAPEGIDALPADSRKHLRDELRNVIIEQGEWQPADANKLYPYTPSSAAEKDPELRQQEEKAWGELIAEYHKREAAALAAGGGRNGGQDPGEDQTGTPGSGRQGQDGSSSGSGGGKSSSDPAERSATEAASGTAAGAGVSQSALDFLKNQSGGQPGGQANDQTGDPVSATSMASGRASSAPAGQQQSPPEQIPQNAVADATADKPEEADEEKSDEAEPLPPPGSVAIAELVALEEMAKRQAAEQDQVSEKLETADASEPSTSTKEEAETAPSVTLQSSDQPPPPPGTIAIPELEKLKGMDEAAPLATKQPNR
jgi:hypothetical protein